MTAPKWQLVNRSGFVEDVSIGAIRGGGWGFEAGDRGSFVNPLEASRNASFTCHDETDDGSAATWHVHMAEGHWQVRRRVETLGDRTLEINQELAIIAPSMFQDFVMRFTFTRDSFDWAEIDGERITHRNSNKYFQHETRSVTLGNATGRLSVDLPDAVIPPEFRLEMYVRDAPGHWIVHARFMPRPPYTLYWFRWANRWFTFGFGPFLSKVVAGLPGLGPALWRRSERTGKHPNLQWQGIAALDSDARARICARLTYERV